jgi:hypothetical protein
MGIDSEVDPTSFDLSELDHMYHVNVFAGSEK